MDSMKNSLFFLALFCANGVFAATSVLCNPLSSIFGKAPTPKKEARVEGTNERVLRSLGFRESYIKGLDRVEGYLRLAQKLRSGDIDPDKDHIEEFVALAEAHLRYVEEGIRTAESLEEGADRLAILEDFGRETSAWVRDRTLTYRKFVNLGYRLSILATPKTERGRGNLISNPTGFRAKLYETGAWKSDDRLEAAYLASTREKNQRPEPIYTMLDRFPDTIIMPHTDGILGKMAISRLSAKRVYIHALLNHRAEADGHLRNPDWIFRHDSAHMHLREDTISLQQGVYETMLSSFLDSFSAEMEKPRTKTEREMLELVYYTIVYESPRALTIRDNTPNTQRLRKHIWVSDILNPHARAEQLPLGLKPSERAVRKYIDKSMDVFDRVAEEVFQRIPH